METTDSDFFSVVRCHLKPLFLLSNSFKHLLHFCSYLPPFQSTTTCQELCSILFFCILHASPLTNGWPQIWYSELYLKMMSILVQTKTGSSCPPLLREKRPWVSSLLLLICRGDCVGWEPQGGTAAMRHSMSHGYGPWSENALHVPVLRCFFQCLVARAGCKRSCVAARRGLCVRSTHCLWQGSFHLIETGSTPTICGLPQ